MKISNINMLSLFALILLFASCESKPRVIESQEVSSNNNSIPSLKEVSVLETASTSEHKVVVEEKLDTEKYTYLYVTEGGEKFWIAVSKRDVTIGDTYYYKGGLLKKNFQSREHNRVFETLYLVSNIWKQPAGGGNGSALEEAIGKTKGEVDVDLTVGSIEPAEGAIKISELLADKEKYNGKLVKVTGKVIKVNPMIMNRNWLHIKDSSTDELDLTVTTTENIPLGAVLSLEGTIAVDKDFGAGYRYDIIMEGAVLK